MTKTECPYCKTKFKAGITRKNVRCPKCKKWFNKYDKPKRTFVSTGWKPYKC